jgi:hypothetical protein
MVVESHDDLSHKNLFYIKTLYIYNVFSYPRIILTRLLFEWILLADAVAYPSGYKAHHFAIDVLRKRSVI